MTPKTKDANMVLSPDRKSLEQGFIRVEPYEIRPYTIELDLRQLKSDFEAIEEENDQLMSAMTKTHINLKDAIEQVKGVLGRYLRPKHIGG